MTRPNKRAATLGAAWHEQQIQHATHRLRRTQSEVHHHRRTSGPLTVRQLLRHHANMTRVVAQNFDVLRHQTLALRLTFIRINR